VVLFYRGCHVGVAAGHARKESIILVPRLLLYSDEPILVGGLESVLRRAEGFELLPTCATVACLMEQMTASEPDVILMALTVDITFDLLTEMRHAALRLVG
jgi:hypothetical protein